MICFHPDRYIIGAEAFKMTACSIGYGIIAKTRGGYPGGYINVFDKNALIFNANDTLTFEDAIKWIYEIIDVVIVYNSLTNPTEEYCFGSYHSPTLREMFFEGTVYTEEKCDLQGQLSIYNATLIIGTF